MGRKDTGSLVLLGGRPAIPSGDHRFRPVHIDQEMGASHHEDDLQGMTLTALATVALLALVSGSAAV